MHRGIIWITISFILLSLATFTIGMLTEGRISLALKGWGFLFILMAAIATIWCIGPLKLAKLIGRMMPIMAAIVKTAAISIGSILVAGANAQKDRNVNWKTNPVYFLNGHFNRSTGELDPYRMPGGDYDPPYDSTKE